MISNENYELEGVHGLQKTKARRKDHFSLPLFDHQILDRLAGKSHNFLLYGYLRYNQITISVSREKYS